MLSYEEALSVLEEKLRAARQSPPTEDVPLSEARGRVLAEPVHADRDYPPFHRSMRDGFAVRSQDAASAGATLQLAGEVRAGQYWPETLQPGQCVEIMTGAPLPAGADAVAMMEHARVEGGRVQIERALAPFENVARQGSEAAKGRQVLPRGRRLGAGEIGLMASVGKADVSVCRKPLVAILPTGDEIVPIDQTPQWYQVRNSNSVMLSAQSRAAGAISRQMPIGPDNKEALRQRVQEGLKADLLLLSGGVSVGKYDFVKEALAELGAEFYFQNVALRPGKPLVFGRAQGTFFFGLPGNPVSSYVTFELFARPAIAALGGGNFKRPQFLRARLGSSARQKGGFTRFVPARFERRGREPRIEIVRWQGSGDLAGAAAANCLLVIHPDQTALQAGDWVDVLPKLS